MKVFVFNEVPVISDSVFEVQEQWVTNAAFVSNISQKKKQKSYMAMGFSRVRLDLS